MPDFVEGLRDNKEGRGAVGLVFKGFIDLVDDAMCLFNGGVSSPEDELMRRLSSTSGRSRVRSSFSKTLDTIGRRLIGRYLLPANQSPGFRVRMICATFHWEGK
jgi:hypothetical protein